MTNIREEDSEEKSSCSNGSQTFQSSSSSSSNSVASKPASDHPRINIEEDCVARLITLENPEEAEENNKPAEYSGLQKRSLREELVLSKSENKLKESPCAEGLVYMSPIYLSHSKND
jgi:hypothetical protein